MTCSVPFAQVANSSQFVLHVTSIIVMLAKNLLLMLLTFTVAVASIANGSHAVELCHDDCSESTVLSLEAHVELGAQVIRSDSEQEEDCDCPVHQNRCCHHNMFLTNNQSYSLPANLEGLLVSSPNRLISDPHIDGPFQPPKA